MRVGFSQVLKECRLTFFSSAPSMRVHGSMTVVLVGTKDMRFLYWHMGRLEGRWKEATARLHVEGATGVNQLLWLHYQNRAVRRGNLRRRFFDPGLGA